MTKHVGMDVQLGGQVTQCRGGYLARGAGKTSFDLNKFEEDCKTEPVDPTDSAR
jgi:hypothetical protein